MLFDKIDRGSPNDEVLTISPPVFRWPPESLGSGRTYTLQYSRHSDFLGAVTVSGIDRLFYRPLKPLTMGRWFWRFRVDNQTWSETMPFCIATDAALYPTPAWEEIQQCIPTSHPRLWARPESLNRLRNKAAAGSTGELVSRWINDVASYVGQPFPLENVPQRRTVSTDEERVLQLIAAKKDALDSMVPAGDMAFLSLLRPERRDLALEAIRRALAAARLDPNGYTSPEVSDFANGAIVGNTALVYDYLHDHLSANEQDALRDMLSCRLKAMYAEFRPRLEIRPIALHPWQHTLCDFLAGVLAIYHEVPACEEWLHWGLDLFAAFYPWWGGKGGASAEGPQYMLNTGLVSSQVVAELIHTATGMDIMQHPWFAGNADYVIYAHPPGHLRSQFGDRHVNHYPVPDAAIVMNRYAAHFANPYAREYAIQLLEDTHSRGDAEARVKSAAKLLQVVTNLKEPPDPKPLADMPKSKTFPDVGVVIMHSRIDNPSQNVMFEFKSSPYGSLGHAHADQNSFNIIAYNEELVVDSGHYTSYKDDHHSGWTVTTKAHNTLLIGGTGQGERLLSAAGQIVDSYTGSHFHYALGSAASAYKEVKVERLMRHVLWVTPQAYVIFDQVQTAEPTTTQWLLHAVHPLTYHNRWIHCTATKAALKAYVAHPSSLVANITNEFTHPARKWRPNHVGLEFPDQWHLTLSSAKPVRNHYWLAVLFVKQAGQSIDYGVQQTQGDEWVGLNWEQDGKLVELGVALRQGAPIKLNNVTALADMVAIWQDTESAALFAANSTLVEYQNGKPILAVEKPISTEISLPKGALE